MPDSILLALTTCPDEAAAKRIAECLVTERLAACVNRLGGVTSTYFWDGRLQDDAEILLIIKTTTAKRPALEARLKSLHSYDIPELITLEVTGGNDRYLEWVRMGATDKDGMT